MLEKLWGFLKNLFCKKATEMLHENEQSIKESITNFVDEHAPKVLKGQADEVVDKVMDFIEDKIERIAQDEPAEETEDSAEEASEETAEDEYVAN